MKKIIFIFLIVGCSSNSKVSEPVSLAPPSNSQTPTNSASENTQSFPVKEMCYLKEFNEKRFPWKLDDCKNFEEVYQDYQYYEAKLTKATRTLQIKKYIRGDAAEESTYKITGSDSTGWKLAK